MQVLIASSYPVFNLAIHIYLSNFDILALGGRRPRYHGVIGGRGASRAGGCQARRGGPQQRHSKQ